jgi:hypothetical protein
MNDLLRPVKAPIMDADARNEHIEAIDAAWLDAVDNVCAGCEKTLFFNACNTEGGRCPLDTLAATLPTLARR